MGGGGGQQLGYSTVHVYMLGVCMRVGALCKDITSKKMMKALWIRGSLQKTIRTEPNMTLGWCLLKFIRVCSQHNAAPAC